MEYIIFIVIVITILHGYHRVKYWGGTYDKFQYYVEGELSGIIGAFVMLWDVFLKISFVVGIVYLGGKLVKIFINQNIN